MKKIILLTVILLGIFALAGCGNTAEKANTEANQNKAGVLPKMMLNTGIKQRVFGVGTLADNDMSAEELRLLRRQFLAYALVAYAPHWSDGRESVCANAADFKGN